MTKPLDNDGFGQSLTSSAEYTAEQEVENARWRLLADAAKDGRIPSDGGTRAKRAFWVAACERFLARLPRRIR